MGNFWDELMETDDGAAQYMLTYGEGPGTETRKIIGEFINDGESVLDVGCGPGWNMEHFVEYGPQLKRYKGVDYSERFVRVANERRKLNDDETFSTEHILPFEVQDCRALKEPGDSWDVVIMQDVLEHTNGYERPIREALRVARKRVIVVFWKPFRTEGDGDQINDDGNDGYGSNYERAPWEEFLGNLGYVWFDAETSTEANRHHIYYVIDKELR